VQIRSRWSRVVLRPLIGSLLFAMAATAFAYHENFGPFEAAESPKIFPLVKCRPLEQPSKTIIYAAPQSPQQQLKITVTESGNYMATVIDGNGKPISPSTTVCESNEWGMLNGCFTADLNQDGKADFVAQIYLGGCGLAACRNVIVFALSSEKGYKISTLFSMCPSAVDFIDLRKDGDCQFIKTDFIYGDTGKDGKQHNYWVYHLYEIVGTELRPANQLIHGFPKWIWWSFKDNHKATDQLTDGQKATLWSSQAGK